MNQFLLVEDENTFYEIDQKCQVETLKKSPKSSRRVMEQREEEQRNIEQSGENQWDMAQKKNSHCCKNGCSKKIVLLLLICSICQGH